MKELILIDLAQRTIQSLSQQVSSSSFMESAELWNNSQDSTTTDTLNLPVQWTGKLLRGYVSKELISKDAEYT